MAAYAALTALPLPACEQYFSAPRPFTCTSAGQFTGKLQQSLPQEMLLQEKGLGYLPLQEKFALQ